MIPSVIGAVLVVYLSANLVFMVWPRKPPGVPK
jgi:hypothetical protein